MLADDGGRSVSMEDEVYIDQAMLLISKFLSAVAAITGPVSVTVTPPLDVAIFPDQSQKLGGKQNGLYLLSTKQDGRVIYIGISTDIPGRIYTHIGQGFSWAHHGAEAALPACSLAAGRHWLSEPTQELLCKAQFHVTTILPELPEASALLEAFLLYWGHKNNCKPEINVEL